MQLLGANSTTIPFNCGKHEMKIIDRIDCEETFSLKDLCNAFFSQNPYDWRYGAEIVEGYMPPFPREDTKPRLVVRYTYEADDRTRSLFLRYSAGPRQGFFWDSYGDDMMTVPLAFKALVEAPTPPNLWVGKFRDDHSHRRIQEVLK